MKKRTLVIPSLSLISLLCLNACTSDKNYVRNRYDKMEDCLKDYNKEDCEGNESHYTHGSLFYNYYFGPWYHYGSMGTIDSGRTSIGKSYSETASHIINSNGDAVSRSNFSSITKSNTGMRGFSRGGFGSTAKGFSVGS